MPDFGESFIARLWQGRFRWLPSADHLVEPSGWCAWATSSPAMRAYHDEEWGIPTSDDRRLFEKVCLEAFQCGLSWATVLARRQRLREVFAYFDVAEIVRFTSNDLDLIARDPSVIRHRGKITSVLTNARACIALTEEVGSLGTYFWSYASQEELEPLGPKPPATSEASARLSRDLKKRGWTFVGPTTMYALMQSVGMVNDHDRSCPSRQRSSLARSNFCWKNVEDN